MLNIIEINNFNAPELDVYARYTEAQLLNKDRPEDGLFIAESPKVIGRALDAGYIPVSVLVEKKQMEENEETQEVLARFENTGTSIFTAEFAVLTQLTDDSISIDDPQLMSEEKLAVILGTEGDGLMQETIKACDYTVKIPMSHGVDSLNVAAASAVAFWQLRK